MLEDLLRLCVLDFGGSWEDHIPLIEFAYNNSYQSSIKMAPYEALYGRKCRTPLSWVETGERQVLGPQLVDQATEKVRLIRDRLKAALDRQQKYYDSKHKKVEFEVGEFVFLKVRPMKGIYRFRQGGKLSHRYIGPFEIVERIGKVSYKLALSVDMSDVHNVFHMSMLRKWDTDENLSVAHKRIEVQKDLTYVVEPERIIESDVRKLRSRQILYVKIKWKSRPDKEATSERKEEIRQKFPRLFV